MEDHASRHPVTLGDLIVLTPHRYSIDPVVGVVLGRHPAVTGHLRFVVLGCDGSTRSYSTDMWSAEKLA